jgi:hypothetical protein
VSAPHADLSSLRKLRDDWDSYGGVPITPQAIRTAEAVFFVPTSNGGIQVEMHAGGIEVEVEIRPDGRVVSVLVSPPSHGEQNS